MSTCLPLHDSSSKHTWCTFFACLLEECSMHGDLPAGHHAGSLHANRACICLSKACMAGTVAKLAHCGLCRRTCCLAEPGRRRRWASLRMRSAWRKPQATCSAAWSQLLRCSFPPLVAPLSLTLTPATPVTIVSASSQPVVCAGTLMLAMSCEIKDPRMHIEAGHVDSVASWTVKWTSCRHEVL